MAGFRQLHKCQHRNGIKKNSHRVDSAGVQLLLLLLLYLIVRNKILYRVSKNFESETRDYPYLFRNRCALRQIVAFYSNPCRISALVSGSATIRLHTRTGQFDKIHPPVELTPCRTIPRKFFPPRLN